MSQSSGQADFQARLSRIAAVRQSRQPRPGRAAPHAPKPARRFVGGFLRLVFGIWLLAMLLKAATLHHLGPARYDAHLATYQDGPVLQQAGVWLLQPGRASNWLAAQITAWRSPQPPPGQATTDG